MLKIQKDVLDFHKKFNCLINDKPTLINKKDYVLRTRLIEEELDEYAEAARQGDLTEVADALADLMYVIVGTAVSFGIDLEPIWDEVHRSNMEKEGGGTREDGKIMKPVGWKSPDIKRLIEEQIK